MTIPHPDPKSNAEPTAITVADLRAIRVRLALASARLIDLTPRACRRASSEVR